MIINSDDDDSDDGDLVGWFLNVLVNNEAISRTGPMTERLTILRASTHETELGDHDFCLSRSDYTNTDPTSRERAATAGIETWTSSPGVTRSTAELLRLHPPPPPDDGDDDNYDNGDDDGYDILMTIMIIMKTIMIIMMTIMLK